jgi:regulator of protease activity HflC (stomatin/prohibitin superfamily)
MIAFRWLLVILEIGLFGSAGALVIYDVYVSAQLRKLLRRKRDEASAGPGMGGAPGLGVAFGVAGSAGSGGVSSGGLSVADFLGAGAFERVRWSRALQFAVLALVPLFLAKSIFVVPDGTAGVRVSQFWGVRPGTLYPGVHLVTPFVDDVALYDTREQVYLTAATETAAWRLPTAGQAKENATESASINGNKHKELLTVQAREGLNIGIAVAVRYRIDPRRLAYIHANLPGDIGGEVVAPVVASTYRSLAPNYMTREIFALKREELRADAAQAIQKRLEADGVLVREVVLRDIKLPEEYAKGLEGLLLKEQESERLGTETEIKQKQVKIAELEAEAQKARDVKQAEAQAQVRVLQAKAESDSMQYTLPLKQKQIEQSKLEAEARKEATLQNAEAAAQAKVIDSRAEIERQKNLADAEANRIRVTADAEANRIRVTAAADSERMKFEAAVLKQNPMLIQKIIAERLSDKLQIMMVPVDGKNFFANDVFRSAFNGTPSAGGDEDGDGGGQAQAAANLRSGKTRKP